MLRGELKFDQFNQLSISFHLFPQDWNHDDSGSGGDRALYPDLASLDSDRRSALVMKRVIDVIGSGLILVLSAPLLLVIALAIKASSRGPVLFRQERVGHYGRHFTFLKFRSMFLNNDHGVHKEFVTKFIADEAPHPPLNGNGDTDIQACSGQQDHASGEVLAEYEFG